MRQILFILLLIISFSCKKEAVNAVNNDTINPAPFPRNFWIGMPKAYFTAKTLGVKTNAYAVRNQAFIGKLNNLNTQEIIERVKNDTEFIPVITSDKWHLILGDRKDFVSAMQNPEKIKDYFVYIKKLFQGMGNYSRGVVNFEPDPFGSFSKIIRGSYGSDPNNVPAKLSEVDMPEVKELNPPDNFAGFWQVVDFLRYKYAPRVMIAPTIKEWGIPAKIIDEPAGGWNKNSTEVKEMCDYFARYNVNWDALAFNINNKKRTDEDFKKIVRYFTSVAKGMENKKTGNPVYSFIWKTKVSSFHYSKPVEKWDDNELSFEFRNIDFLAAQGVRGMVVGYGSQLAGLYSDSGSLPQIFVCWLKEYFNGKQLNCNPQGTIGLVAVTE